MVNDHPAKALMTYSFLLGPSLRENSTYHSLCYTSRGGLAGSTMRDRSDDPSHHERTFYHGATSCSPYKASQILFSSCIFQEKNKNNNKQTKKQNTQNWFTDGDRFEIHCTSNRRLSDRVIAPHRKNPTQT